MTNFEVATQTPVPASTLTTTQLPTAQEYLHHLTVTPLFARPDGDSAASCDTLGQSQMLLETACHNVNAVMMFDRTAHLHLATHERNLWRTLALSGAREEAVG